MKKQRGFAPVFIVLALLVLGIIVGGAFYLGKQTNKPSTQSLSNINSITSTSPAITLTSDVTNNWKTYTNKQFEFEFKYPSTYLVNDSNFKITNEVDSNFYSLEIIDSVYTTKGQTPGISLRAIKTTKSVDQFIKDDFQKELNSWEELKKELQQYNDAPNPKIISTQDATNGVISAKKVERVKASNAPNNEEIQYYFKKDDVLYILSAHYGSNDEDSRKSGGMEKTYINKVFKTFAFLSKTQTTSNNEILNILPQWTTPMVWSDKKRDTWQNYRLTDDKGNTVQEISLSGYSATTYAKDKSEDKINPLFFDQKSPLRSQGWVEDIGNGAGGPGRLINVIKKDQNGKRKVIIVDQGAGANNVGMKFIVFESDEFSLQ